MPSEGFLQQEEKNKQERTAAANAKEAAATVIFYSKASRFIAGNYAPEVKDAAGRITQREECIRFYENCHTTSDLDEIAFLRASKSYGIDFWEVKTMDEVVQLRTDRATMKYGTSRMSVSEEESTVIRTNR